MTPKEKAKELLDKFIILGTTIRKPKECALICVDEILKTDTHYKNYYNEVKQEIEKI